MSAVKKNVFSTVLKLSKDGELRTEHGNLFHAAGPATTNARPPKFVLVRWTLVWLSRVYRLPARTAVVYIRVSKQPRRILILASFIRSRRFLDVERAIPDPIHSMIYVCHACFTLSFFSPAFSAPASLPQITPHTS